MSEKPSAHFGGHSVCRVSFLEIFIKTMDFPDDDRYQVVHQVSEDCLQYQDRTDDRVMMHLVMRSGRSDKLKKAFYKKVVENLSKIFKSSLSNSILLGIFPSQFFRANKVTL